MKILDLYIGKSVLVGVFFVFLVLLALDTLIGFASESDYIGYKQYTFWHALGYVLLLMPQHMYELFPMITLLGSIVSLGALANSSELVVIRAAGVSTYSLIFSVMKTAFLLMLFAFVIGEVIAPPAQQYAKLKRVKAMSTQVTLNTDYGLWAKDSNTFINVRRVEVDGSLTGIKVYTFNELNELEEIIIAAKAKQKDNNWILKNVTIKQLGNNFKIEKKESMSWKTLLSPDLVDVVSVSPENLAIWNLQSYIAYLEENSLDTSLYKLSFWSKLFMPITIGAMVLIAVPFVLGSLRHASIGQRILVGFIGGLIFYLVNRLSGQAGVVYGLPAFISASTPTIIVLATSLYFIRRIR